MAKSRHRLSFPTVEEGTADQEGKTCELCLVPAHSCQHKTHGRVFQHSKLLLSNWPSHHTVQSVAHATMTSLGWLGILNTNLDGQGREG